MTSSGPCLVEMNCRAMGADGSWVPLAKALTGGYSQPDAAVDAFLDPEAFARLPGVFASPFKAAGQTVFLVSFFSGTVKATPGYDKMLKLKSFVALQTGVKVGSRVELTVDLYTNVGFLVLSNDNPKQLSDDLNAVREMERQGLFEFDEEVDPVQFDMSPDLSVVDAPVGRCIRARSRSSSSVDAPGIRARSRSSSLVELPVEQSQGNQLAVGLAIGFVAGLLSGLFLARRAK